MWKSRPNLDQFGPTSGMPCLAFELGKSDPSISEWLYRLPCAVIGLGEGILSTACDVVLLDETKLPKLVENITNTPMAAMVLVQHLRASENLSIKDALTAESFAYGTLQTGPEFRRWKDSYQGSELPQEEGSPLLLEFNEGRLELTFNRPKSQNAIGVEMRDALCEAFDLVIVDPSITKVILTGQGNCFSTGGAIEEFGQVSDAATAHWIRNLRLPAHRMAQIRDRLHMHVNGAAVGAGAEILGLAARVTAGPKTWFQLPELKYGLIPGAGGTAGLPHRIGRQRLAYWACLLYTSPSPRDQRGSRMPSSA